MADYNLFEIADIESLHRVQFNTVDFLLTDALDIVLDDNDVFAIGDSPTDDTVLSLNRNNQQVHEDEESLRGKLVIDVPSFSAFDIRMIQICHCVHRYLMDGTIDPNKNCAFCRSIIKMAKICFLKDDVLYKRSRGIIWELADTHTAQKRALQYAHDGAGHRGMEGTFIILASCF